MLNSYLNCSPVTLPALPAYSGDSGESETPRLSQIGGLLIIPKAAPLPDDWTSEYDVTASATNTVTDNYTGRFLVGKGAMPAPADNTIVLGRVNKILASSTYTVTVEVLLGCPAKFTFLAALKGNWKGFTFWPYTIGETLIGGAAGITPSYVSVAMPLGGGRTDVETATITIEFRAKGEPPRSVVPGLFTGAAGMEPSPEIDTLMARQSYLAQVSNELVWTANGGVIPSPAATRFWVYRNGVKMDQSLSEYNTASGPSPGQSTITLNNHISGDNYEVFAFI